MAVIDQTVHFTKKIISRRSQWLETEQNPAILDLLGEWRRRDRGLLSQEVRVRNETRIGQKSLVQKLQR